MCCRSALKIWRIFARLELKDSSCCVNSKQALVHVHMLYDFTMGFCVRVHYESENERMATFSIQKDKFIILQYNEKVISYRKNSWQYILWRLRL